MVIGSLLRMHLNGARIGGESGLALGAAATAEHMDEDVGGVSPRGGSDDEDATGAQTPAGPGRMLLARRASSGLGGVGQAMESGGEGGEVRRARGAVLAGGLTKQCRLYAPAKGPGAGSLPASIWTASGVISSFLHPNPRPPNPTLLHPSRPAPGLARPGGQAAAGRRVRGGAPLHAHPGAGPGCKGHRGRGAPLQGLGMQEAGGAMLPPCSNPAQGLNGRGRGWRLEGPPSCAVDRRGQEKCVLWEAWLPHTGSCCPPA